jgi:hypothetical protein
MFMFSWTSFCRSTISSIDDPKSRQDAELLALLSSSTTPHRKVDEFGRLFPNTATINQHPDPSNFRRVLQIRNDSAKEEGDASYLAYSEKFLKFLDSVAPFSESNPLYVVHLCTNSGFYDFLYAPAHEKSVFASTGHLANLRARS